MPARHRGGALALVLAATLSVIACAHESTEADARAALRDERTSSSPGRSSEDTATGSETAPSSGGEELDTMVAVTSPPRERPDGAIFRDELERATHQGRPAYLLRQLGLTAVREQGRFLGWRIGELWPDDPAVCRDGCDLRTGDIVLKVNGQRLELPESLDQLMAQIPKASKLEVDLVRDGVVMRKSWAVVDAPSQ